MSWSVLAKSILTKRRPYISTLVSVENQAVANCSPSRKVLSMMLKFAVFERKSPTGWYGIAAARR